MLLSTNGVSLQRPFVIVLLCACRYPFYSGAHYLVGDVQIYLKQACFWVFLVSLFSIWLLSACKSRHNREYTVKIYTVCRHVTDLKQQTVKQPSFLCNSSSEFASGSSDLSTRTISSKWIYCLKVSGHTPHTNTHTHTRGSPDYKPLSRDGAAQAGACQKNKPENPVKVNLMNA